MCDDNSAGAKRFSQNALGSITDVLWEQVRGASEAGFWQTGLTDNYIRVEMTHANVMTNQITPTHLVDLTEHGIRGELAIPSATL